MPTKWVKVRHYVPLLHHSGIRTAKNPKNVMSAALVLFSGNCLKSANEPRRKSHSLEIVDCHLRIFHAVVAICQGYLRLVSACSLDQLCNADRVGDIRRAVTATLPKVGFCGDDFCFLDHIF